METTLKKLRQRCGVILKSLKRETLQRKAAEIKLEKSEQHHRRLLNEARSMQEHLRHLSRQILLAQEEERKEISRELHDEIAQILSGINVHMASLKVEDAANTKSLKRKITSTQKLVERSVKIVHRFARDLRPAILDDLGLIPALHSYMKGFTERTRIPIHFKASLGVEKLNFIKRTMFYRVVQAALTNVAQHAQASSVKVTIQKKPGAVYLQVEDNGKSFRVQDVLFAKKNKRLGLLGMRERVEMVGGKFTVESIKGKGTVIGAEVPIS